MGLELKEIVEGMSGKRVRQILNENMQATVAEAEDVAREVTHELEGDLETIKTKLSSLEVDGDELKESVTMLSDRINSLDVESGSLPENIIETNDDGFFIVDENLNIGAMYTKNGAAGFGGGESLAGLTYKII